MLFPLPKGISYKRRRGSVPLGSLLGLVPKFIFDLIRGLFLRHVTASTLSSGHLDLESRLTGLDVSHPTGIAESTSDIWYFAVCNCLFSSDMKLAELREKSFVSMSWLSATASLSCNKTSTNKCFDMFLLRISDFAAFGFRCFWRLGMLVVLQGTPPRCQCIATLLTKFKVVSLLYWTLFLLLLLLSQSKDVTMSLSKVWFCGLVSLVLWEPTLTNTSRRFFAWLAKKEAEYKAKAEARWFLCSYANRTGETMHESWAVPVSLSVTMFLAILARSRR